MPTKTISKALLGAVAVTALSAPAFAGGNCGAGPCAVPVQVMDGYAPSFDPMTVQNMQPMQHLRSVNFQRSPNVSITRVHGMTPTASLSDAPSAFSGTCHPTSTQYCRTDMGRPVQVELAPQPVFQAPPAPVYQPAPVFQPAPAPVVQAPREPRVVAIGGGYDPSKFAPRTYGDATFVPGIAHVPTSIIDRDPVNAQRVLDTGRAVPQQRVVPGTGTAPHMGMVRQSSNYSLNLPGTFRAAPMQRSVRLPGTYAASPVGLPQAGAPVLQQSGPLAGSYGSTVGADGSYWEKVSGATVMGNTLATSVICKRQVQTQVTRPVIGVPTPVPVAVPQGCKTVEVDSRYGDPKHKKHKAHKAPHHMGAPHPHQQHQRPLVPGRWVH